MANAIIYILSSVLIWLSVLLLALTTTGCGSGEEDDTESSSSATTDLTQCGDVTFNVPEEEIEAIIEEAEEEGKEVVVEEMENSGGLDQQTRTFKIIVVGCNNTVVNEDNDVSSDDDISTNLNTAGAE